MNVPTLFADGVELVKEQDAWRRADILEQPCEPRIGLAEIGTDESVIADSQQRYCDRFGDRLGKRSFAVPRWSRKQNTMSRLHALGAQ